MHKHISWICVLIIYVLSFRERYGGINDGISETVEYETAQKYKARWKSIWVLYMTMFFSSVGKKFFVRVKKLLFVTYTLKENLEYDLIKMHYIYFHFLRFQIAS